MHPVFSQAQRLQGTRTKRRGVYVCEDELGLFTVFSRRAVTIIGLQLVIWGSAVALRTVRGADLAALVGTDPLWMMDSALLPYWVGLIISLIGLLLSRNIGVWWRVAGVIIITVLARG